METVCFKIPLPNNKAGKPKMPSKQRHRTIPVKGGGFRMIPDKSTKLVEDTIYLVAASCIPETIDKPVRIDIVAVFPRPQYMQKRNRHGEPKYPPDFLWCEAKPDKDNIEKLVLDGMKSRLPKDECVVIGDTMKVYERLDHNDHGIYVIVSDPGNPHDEMKHLLSGVTKIHDPAV